MVHFYLFLRGKMIYLHQRNTLSSYLFNYKKLKDLFAPKNTLKVYLNLNNSYGRGCTLSLNKKSNPLFGLLHRNLDPIPKEAYHHLLATTTSQKSTGLENITF